MYISLVTFALLSASAVASPLVKSPDVLLGRAPTYDTNPAPVCKVRTFYGPYTLKVEIEGFSRSDSYYAEKLDDGSFLVTAHGDQCLPLGIQVDINVTVDLEVGQIEPQPEVPEYVATQIITESWGTKTHAFTIGGSQGPTTYCATKTIGPGSPEFPGGIPNLPKPVYGGWPKVPAPTNGY